MKEQNDVFYNVSKYYEELTSKTANLPVGFCKKTIERFGDRTNGVIVEEVSTGNHEEFGPYISKTTREFVQDGTYEGDVKATLRMIGYLQNNEGTGKNVVYAEYSALDYSPAEFGVMSFRNNGDNEFVECDECECSKNFGDLFAIVMKATMDTKTEDITASENCLGN